MAQAVIGALRVDLSADAGAFTQGVDKASKRFRKFSSEITQASRKIRADFLQIAAAAAAIKTVTSAIRSVTDSSARFEKGMSNISTLIDTSAESMKDMGDEVLEIGKRVPVAINDLTTGLYDVRSAGIASSDAIMVLDRSSRLAVAGLGSTAEAVDLVTSALNAFDLQGRHADDVYNQIFKTVKSGKTTISKLAQGFGAVAGTVAKADIKLDDYLSAVAALTTTGLPAAKAHTQLRSAIAGLTRETELSKKVFEALNVKTFPELISQSGSLGVAFQRIVNSLDGNDAALIKLLGSVEAYNAVIAIADKQNKAYIGTLGEMRDGTDQVSEAFEKQSKTMSATLQRISNNFEEASIVMGERFQPLLEKIADLTSFLTGELKKAQPEVKGLGTSFKTLTYLMGPVPAIYTKLVETIKDTSSKIAPYVDSIVASLKKIYAAMLLFSSGQFSAGLKQLTDDVKKTNDTLKDTADLANELRGGIFDDGSFGEGAEALKGWKTALEETLPTLDQFNDSKVVLESLKTTTNELSGAQQLYNQLVEEGNRLVTDMQTPQEILAEKAKALDAALAQNSISAKQFGSAMQRATMVAVNSYANMAGQIAGNLAAAFENSKAFAIAAAVINTAESVTKSLATYGFTPWGIAAAASAAAAGAAQIAAIKSASKNSGGTTSASVPAAAPAASEGGEAGRQQLVTINLQGETYGREQVRALIEDINEAVADGAVLKVA